MAAAISEMTSLSKQNMNQRGTRNDDQGSYYPTLPPLTFRRLQYLHKWGFHKTNVRSSDLSGMVENGKNNFVSYMVVVKVAPHLWHTVVILLSVIFFLKKIGIMYYWFYKHCDTHDLHCAHPGLIGAVDYMIWYDSVFKLKMPFFQRVLDWNTWSNIYVWCKPFLMKVLIWK